MSSTPGAGPGPGSSHPTAPHLAQRPTIQEEHTAKYGHTANLNFHHEFAEREPPKRLRDLFAQPTIRQWIENGKLYRECSPREISRFELFFDLLFVGIIHQLAEAAAEEPGGPAVARFILTFWPSWSVWEEARRYSNVSGTDDLFHRLWVLVGMICLLGYSVNASAIELEPHGEEAELDHTAVHCAAAFWLIIKLSRVLVLWLYAWRLPKFRLSQFLAGCAVLVPMFVYLPLIWVTNRHAQIVLAAVGIAVDLIRFDAIFFYIGGRYIEWKAHKEQKRRVATGELDPTDATKLSWNLLKMVSLPEGLRLPAVNIEHSIERSSAFVVIVLGELVMNLLYIPHKHGQFGASHMYAKAVFGIMIAWGLNYFYTLQTETPFPYVHALRRSWFTGVFFTFFHWPLCAALLLASSSAVKMVESDDVDEGLKWYWGAGLGCAQLFIALIDLLHHRVQPVSSERIPRIVRFLFAVAGSLALILFPLSSHRLTSIAMMGIALSITWTTLAVYIYGMLPTKTARLALEREEAEHPEPEPVIIETDLHRSSSRHTAHSLHSRKSRRSFIHLAEDTEAVIGVSN